MANRRVQFRLDHDVDRVVDDWNRFIREIPDVERENSRKMAEFFADSIRRTIRSKLMWRGEMLDSVMVTPKGGAGGDFTVTVNAPIPGRSGDYAAWNEFASKGHFVRVLERNNPLDRWARARGIPEGTLLYVEPTPFMNSSIRQASQRLNQYLQRGGELDKFFETHLGG